MSQEDEQISMVTQWYLDGTIRPHNQGYNHFIAFFYTIREHTVPPLSPSLPPPPLPCQSTPSLGYIFEACLCSLAGMTLSGVLALLIDPQFPSSIIYVFTHMGTWWQLMGLLGDWFSTISCCVYWCPEWCPQPHITCCLISPPCTNLSWKR